MPQYYHKL